MKIKIASGNYPTVVDGEYTEKHFLLTPQQEFYCYDGDLIVPGFAKIHLNSQTAIIEVNRKDYIVVS